MKVFLCKNVEKIGMEGEILKVNDGFARNFLIPHKLAVEITAQNENFYRKKVKLVEHRKEVIVSKTSLLAERIKETTISIKKKMHDDGKLYGAINGHEVANALQAYGISVSKNQVLFEKAIKNKGTHEVTIKLTSRLQPSLKIQVIPE